MQGVLQPPRIPLIKKPVLLETLLGTPAVPEVGIAAYEEEAVDAAPDAEADTFRVEFATTDPEAGMIVGMVMVGVGGREARRGGGEGGRVGGESVGGKVLPVQLQDSVKLK